MRRFMDQPRRIFCAIMLPGFGAFIAGKRFRL